MILACQYCGGIELPMNICLDCGTVQGDWPLG